MLAVEPGEDLGSGRLLDPDANDRPICSRGIVVI
jgi:hypothetical protein